MAHQCLSHTRTHACAHTQHIHTYAHTKIHTTTQTYTNTHIHTHQDTHIKTDTQQRHTPTHRHTHRHTHIHTNPTTSRISLRPRINIKNILWVQVRFSNILYIPQRNCVVILPLTFKGVKLVLTVCFWCVSHWDVVLVEVYTVYCVLPHGVYLG